MRRNKIVIAFLVCLLLVGHSLYSMNVPSYIPQSCQQNENESEIQSLPGGINQVAYNVLFYSTIAIGVYMLLDKEEGNDYWGHVFLVPFYAVSMIEIIEQYREI